MDLTLPVDSDNRKGVPLYSGCYAYFPAALAGVAAHSKAGNDKHNPGEPMHHARGKSGDHADCIARHCMDIADMLAYIARAPERKQEDAAEMTVVHLLAEANALAWRALAWSQELHEIYGGKPLAPGARTTEPEHYEKVAAAMHVLAEPLAPDTPMCQSTLCSRIHTVDTPCTLRYIEPVQPSR